MGRSPHHTYRLTAEGVAFAHDALTVPAFHPRTQRTRGRHLA